MQHPTGEARKVAWLTINEDERDMPEARAVRVTDALTTSGTAPQYASTTARACSENMPAALHSVSVAVISRLSTRSRVAFGARRRAGRQSTYRATVTDDAHARCSSSTSTGRCSRSAGIRRADPGKPSPFRTWRGFARTRAPPCRAAMHPGVGHDL